MTAEGIRTIFCSGMKLPFTVLFAELLLPVTTKLLSQIPCLIWFNTRRKRSSRTAATVIFRSERSRERLYKRENRPVEAPPEAKSCEGKSFAN